MRTILGAIVVSVGLFGHCLTAYATKTEIRYLSGIDKDRTVDWDFRVNGGRQAGEWRKLAVPSNWEMQGFGTYRYGNDWEKGNLAPDSEGSYRYFFSVPETWMYKRVRIVFGGVMTDAEVFVNGKLVGNPHRGGFYQFSYDLNGFLRFSGENRLEVRVKRFSSNATVNRAERRADYWMFSGIHRPVWLEAFPETHMERISIDGRHTGKLKVKVAVQNAFADDTLVAQVEAQDGEPVGRSFQVRLTKEGDSVEQLQAMLANVEAWTAETPNLYQIRISLMREEETLHTEIERFGFRTVEVRPKEGLFVNGVRIQVRGVNRHTIWPTTGRTTSRTISTTDVNLIKDMNMNAVRMAHYPPEKHFLQVTDELGLYVINELAGWQDAYDTEIGRKLVKELIVRDHNHPSVIMWANGNEGGWNTNLDADFDYWDLQDRPVIHPWEHFGYIDTDHYEEYGCCEGRFFGGDSLFMPTEFLHSLYDGGAGAGLEDWWKLMRTNPLAVGGFIWAFSDEGIVREDQDGRIDVAGNRAPDGIVGPFREKEGSFSAIKEIWSPVYLPLSEKTWLPDSFNGTIEVENRYDFTNFSTHSIQWELVTLPSPWKVESGETVTASQIVVAPDIPARNTGNFSIVLPTNWQLNDVLRLRIFDGVGREIYTWTWPLKRPLEIASTIVSTISSKDTIRSVVNDNILSLYHENRAIRFDLKTGHLVGASHGEKDFPLANGPRVVEGESKLNGVSHGPEVDGYSVVFKYNGALQEIHWHLMSNGWLRLRYNQHERGFAEKYYIGATFDFPDDQITRIDWVGNGPYRVWKNRLKGVEYGVWGKRSNNTVTGHSWAYPEFKGFHANLNWALIEVAEQGAMAVVTENENLYLQLLRPEEPEGEGNEPKNTHVELPDGNISFLHAIAPIGTKFIEAQHHGPAGQKYRVPLSGESFETTLFFYFGAPP